MAWLNKQDKEILELLVRETEIPIMFSGSDGKIYWANQAFEEFIGYALWELTTGTNGKGITWDKLSVSGESLEADHEMVKQCLDGDRYKYTLKKQYIPKNSQPVWAEINVIRYPSVGTFQCFIVVVNPLKNGTQTAFALSMDRIKDFTNELIKLRERQNQVESKVIDGVSQKMSEKTETEQIFVATARLINKNQRVSAAVFLTVMVMILGTQLVQAIETVKKLMGW